MIADKKDIVQAFVAASAEGYKFAIDHPDEAANVLIKAEPTLNADLVRASQNGYSPKYQDDAKRWGEQKLKFGQIMLAGCSIISCWTRSSKRIKHLQTNLCRNRQL